MFLTKKKACWLLSCLVTVACMILPSFATEPNIQASSDKPGKRINVNGLRLQPFVNLSGTYDSNVTLDSGEVSDYLTETLFGVNIARESERLSLEGQVWGNVIRYDDLKDRESDGYGEYFGIAYQPADKVELTLNQKYAHLTDFEYDLLYTGTGLVSPLDKTERYERDIFSIDGGIEAPVSDKMDLTLAYAYGFVDYERDTSFDSSEHIPSLELVQCKI
ncbi:MAG: hypothetical protein RRC34_05990 [Lentisphaeria bacterium]|nr:hypothetical protein [Lentisphaeria bacterium]